MLLRVSTAKYPTKSSRILRDNSLKGFISKSVRYLLPKGLHPTKYSSVSFRTGNVGEWVQYFSADDLEYFNLEAGQLNCDLGYS